MRTGVGLWVRAELRRRWRALLLLAVLCGLVVAVVLVTVAGARRTTTAYDRFLHEASASHADVQMFVGMRGRTDVDLGNGKTADDVAAELRRLPQVEALEVGFALMLVPPGADFYTSASLDGYTVNRPLPIDGRLPRGLDEMALSRGAAESLKKGVGDRLALEGYGPRQAERFILEGDASVLQEPPDGPRVALHVVGVVESAGDIGSVDLSGPYGVVSPEFYRRHRDAVGQFGPVAVIRLRDGFRDLPALRAAVRRLVGDSEFVTIEDKRADREAVNDALDVQALALLLFAGVAGAAGLAAVGTVVSRQLAASGGDGHVLSSLGLTRGQRALALMGVASPAVVGGLVLGFGGALAASPLLPLGLGRRAEPDPGISFDAVTLPLGAAGLGVLLVVIVAFAAWQGSRPPSGRGGDAERPPTPGFVARWISRAGLDPVAATGLRLAFERGSTTRPVPTRAAVAAAVFATAGVAAVLVFGASLTHLVDRPELSGFPWDAAAGGGLELENADETVARVVDDGDVEAVTVGQLTDTTVAGETTQLLAIRPAKGNVGLSLIEGRAPAAPDEVAVGPKTMDRLRERDTDCLELATEDGGTRRFRVVGTANFPIVNYTGYDNGVWLVYEALEGVQNSGGNSVVLIRLDPDADVSEKRAELEELGFDFTRFVPAKIENLDEAEGFPQALAAFLAVLGLVTVGHALASSPRRRRRDLAVLRTLGLVRRQVGATLAVQATAVVVVGLVVGVPLGIAAGRSVWGLVASGLSVVRRPIVPMSVVLVVPAALLVANLMALGPGRQAARIRPAEVLHVE